VIRIAIIENEALVRGGLRRLLELDPEMSVVGEAGDADAGLALLRAARPDLALVDVRMPGADGVELICALRRESAPPPCIVLTTFDDPDVALQAIRAGARGYLLKDVSLEQLGAAIRAVAAGGTFFQPGLSDGLLRASEDIPRVAPDATEPLTNRESEVLRLMAGGFGNREIAGALGIAERTVKNHVSAVLAKLGVSDRTRAVLKALKQRLV
jgi:DNA-binding NarL/FixJ family response regulator